MLSPHVRKKTTKGQCMATILWTTAQYSDKPVELSATPMVITQATSDALREVFYKLKEF